MELLDVIFGGWHVLPRVKDSLHSFGLACDFLLVAAVERSNPEIREQLSDLPVGQLAAFGPGRGTNTLNSGTITQSTEPLRSKRTQCSPGSFELGDA